MTEQTPLQTNTTFWLDDWHVDPGAGRLTRHGAEIRLEPKVMNLLMLLASHAGEVMSREAIEAEVWKGVVVGYDALASTVIKLRKALGDDSRQPRYIETVSKKGYRLIAKVHNSPIEPIDEHTTPPQSGQPLYRAVLLASAMLVLVLILIILLRQDKPDTTGIPTNHQQASLVVLPFVNLSDDPQQEYFSDGITDDLITDLSQYSGLSVVSRRSAFIYKTHSVDLQTLARELGIRYVVEGSVRLANKSVRINVQLVDAHTGLNLWAHRYDGATTGLFDVQDEVRQKIVKALEVTLTAEERIRQQKRYTESFDAYDYFLRGQAQLVRRASARDNNQARELMEKAIAIDPGFARAHAALALIQADAYRFDWTDTPEKTRQLALQSGQLAIKLDAHSPQASWIMGYIYLFLFEDHDKAITAARRAIELDHDNADAMTTLAVIYTFGDNPEKARLLMQEIKQKNRHYSAMVPSVLGLANLRLGHYNESLKAYNESLLINPSRIQANVAKVVVLYRMGNQSDAAFQLDELYNYHPNFKLDTWVARQPFKDRNILNDMKEALIKAGARPN